VPPTAVTSEERRTAIDRQLNQSLGTFDSELRKEQERVAKERDDRAATSAGSATTDETSDEDTDGASDEDGGSADTEAMPGSDGDTKDADGKRPGDLKSERTSKSGTSSGSNSPNGAGSANIPDGSDDDIVARRLRKAAEQETDPELKEKLWKEYIEYKKNTGK
jgi:hypothetical protein